MKKISIIAAGMLCMAAGVHTSYAQTAFADDANVIEFGKTYQFEEGSPVYTLQIPEDGLLIAEWNRFNTAIAVGEASQYFLYTNPSCTESYLAVPNSISEGKQGYVVDFIVKAGETYYVSTDQYASVVFTLDTEASTASHIVSIEPTPGKAYDISNFPNGWNIICAPKNASATSVEFSYMPTGSETAMTVNVATPTMEAGVLVVSSEQLTPLIREGAIEENSDIVFTIKGLKAGEDYVESYKGAGADYVEIGENGDVTVTFIVSKAIEVVKENFPSPFYQKFSKGDEGAVATIEYTGDIAGISEVTVIEGEVVQGAQSSGNTAPASVTVPPANVTFEGNTLKIDFGGINMTSLNPGKVTVWVAGVMGENGLYANYDGASVGTFYQTLVEGDAAVTEIMTENEEGVYYNLQGIKVENPEHGIFILNGKKVIK